MDEPKKPNLTTDEEAKAEEAFINDPEDHVDGIEYPVFPGFLDARFPARKYDIGHFAFPLFRSGVRTG